MIYEKSVGGDEVARAISLFAEAGRQSLDWAAFWRAVAENRHEEVERQRDAAVVDTWLGRAPTEGASKAPTADPEELAIEVNAIFLASVVRFGQAWQRLLEERAPIIREYLEDFQAMEGPKQVVRDAVVAQARLLLRDVGELVRDQASRFDADLRRLEQEVLTIG